MQKSRYFHKIRKKAGRAINRYGLIGSGDRIVIGLSGGKDSLVLLDILAERRNYIPIDYTLYAVHIDITNVGYKADLVYLASLCKNLGVRLVTRSVTVDLDRSLFSPCYLCSMRRRNELFSIAGELGCTKLALGHHMDDMVETMLLNMVYQGNISTMPPKLSLFSGELYVIRPLTFITDEELLEYARFKGFITEKALCPHRNATKRSEIKKVIDQFQQLYGKAKNNMFRAMSNIHHDYLP